MTNPVATKKQLPAALVLTIICLVAALVLGATNSITAPIIKEHEMAAQREAFGAVMTADEYAELAIPEGSGVSTFVEAKDADGNTVGYCVVASVNGYAGPVTVTLGVDTHGHVTGAKIGDANFVETAGFGSRWLADNKAEEFKGIDIAEGGQIEALAGATVTSNAVRSAANKALSLVASHMGKSVQGDIIAFGVKEKEEVVIADDAVVAYGVGFAGQDVGVIASMNADGTIATIATDMSKQLPPICDLCNDEAFLSQFIGKAGPFVKGENVDIVTGATFTSDGIIEACNKLLNGEGVPYTDDSVEASAAADGSITTSGMGFAGQEVSVTVTLNEDGTIATITTDMSKQAAPVCNLCDETFLSQFIGKAGPFVKGENVDIVTGATFTSEGIIEAVNKALAAGETAAPVGETYEGTAKGFQSDVKVAVTVDNGVITGLTIDTSAETAGFGTRCAEDAAFVDQFIGKTVPVEAFDALSGATVTSDAVVAAINAAIPAAPAGETYEGTAKGFQSDVKVAVTVDNGVITGLTIDTSAETAGFGTRCAEDAAFVDQFIGKTVPVEAFDALSGATVTSDAVVAAINAAVPAASAEEAPAGNVVEGTAKGFQSDVKVTVTLDDAGTILALTIDSAAETAGFGTRCAEDANFINQFIGKTAPFAAGENVDVLSGATVTSEAIIDAINSVFPTQDMSIAGEVASTPVTLPEVQEPAGTTYEGTAKGFQSDVKVTVTVDENGVITALTIDSAAETAGFGTRCAEDEAYIAQFIGQTAPVTADALSGATVTSNAVVEAINAALPTTTVVEAAAPGFLGEDVIVTVEMDAQENIVSLTIDLSKQQLPFANLVNDAFLNQFIGKAGPFEGVDTVTNATATSQGVIDAINVVYAPVLTTKTAAAAGFLGEDVTVTAVVDEDGVIVELTIDLSKQKVPFANLVNDEFLAQFIGQAGPFTVDAVAGATATANAVIEAINSLYAE